MPFGGFFAGQQYTRWLIRVYMNEYPHRNQFGYRTAAASEADIFTFRNLQGDLEIPITITTANTSSDAGDLDDDIIGSGLDLVEWTSITIPSLDPTPDISTLMFTARTDNIYNFPPKRIDINWFQPRYTPGVIITLSRPGATEVVVYTDTSNGGNSKNPSPNMVSYNISL